jgi:NAD(P)-dependent dehydrogenase (short-subunit alcohol dehydrogenase family)
MSPTEDGAADRGGSVAVITGAGSGIGRACARLLARQGASVVLAGRTETSLAAAAAAVVSEGGRAVQVVADLTREGDARAVVAAAVDGLGRLDLAVNAAGSVAVGPLTELDEAEFDAVLAANLRTTWLALKYEIPAIAASGGGAVVNVSSRAGLVGVPGGAAYSAAKHGVVGLTRSAALEAGPLGVRVNAICPGPIRTEQFERIAARIMPGVPSDEVAAQFGEKLPLGRIGTAEEVAAAVAWILSDAAGFMTGAAVALDGGSGAG